MGKDSSAPDTDSNDLARIEKAAIDLFGAHGYDGTTDEMIAETAGVPRQAVLDAGGRNSLYRRILEQCCREQCAILDDLAARLGAGDDRVATVFSRMLQYHVDRRDILVIWRERRRLDAAEMNDIEERYIQPVYQRMADIVGPETAESDEFHLLVIVFGWCLAGFTVGGATRPDGTVLDPEDEGARTEFRSFMEEILHRLRHPPD